MLVFPCIRWVTGSQMSVWFAPNPKGVGVPGCAGKQRIQHMRSQSPARLPVVLGEGAPFEARGFETPAQSFRFGPPPSTPSLGAVAKATCCFASGAKRLAKPSLAHGQAANFGFGCGAPCPWFLMRRICFPIGGASKIICSRILHGLRMSRNSTMGDVQQTQSGQVAVASRQHVGAPTSCRSRHRAASASSSGTHEGDVGRFTGETQ